MNLLICDDDELFCEQLKKLLYDYFNKYHLKNINIYTHTSGESAIKSTVKYDIAFLDVEMYGLSGIHTAKELSSRNPKLIFFVITSHPQYLDEALRFHAFRYLPKPLDKNRLYLNLKDALYIYNTYEKKVLIETTSESISVASSSIIMIEVAQRKVHVHTQSGEYISIKPLKHWIDVLSDLPFFQSHKSYLVNFAHIERFDDNTIHLTNNLSAYLTRRKHTEFKRQYLIYLDTTI